MVASFKIVALDQNAWIALSRIHYGLDSSARKKVILEHVEDAARSGLCIFPVTIERSDETLKHSSPERRQRLARFMADFSDGLTFGPGGNRLLRLECRNYLIDKYRIDASKSAFPESILGRGVEGLQGGRLEWVRKDGTNRRPTSDELEKMRRAEEFARSKEAIYHLFSDDLPEEYRARNDLLDELDRIRSDGKTDMEKGIELGRKIKDKQARTGLAMLDFVLDTLLPILVSEARKLGFDYLHEAKKIEAPSDIRNILEGIPSAHVVHELVQARDASQNKPVDINDFNDISFLSYSIPYADVVVTERKWVEFLKRSRLNTIYGTAIISNLSEITNYL